MRPYRPPFILALTIYMLSLNAWAGTQNATVTGSVYVRSSGALLAGATVHLINAGIGFSQTQITGSDGAYTFNSVPPAENYVISVEHSGFAPAVLTDIVLQVDEEKLLLPPFLLESTGLEIPEPAQTPRQIAPQANAPVPMAATRQSSKAPLVSLDLLSTTQSGVVDSRWVHNLPLVNRDFIDLALLVPGTYPVEQGSELEGASLVVNGARANMNNFLLDGADNNDYTINQSLPFQIVEAMQEFRVQASTENAEFGRSGGAQINVVSRSGSHAIHGELFEFNRNSALSARNFFSSYSGGTFNQYAREIQILGGGNPLTDPTLAGLYNQRNPSVNQNQFGGNIGGPLFIKDRLFGFLNWESFRLANPRPLFEEVPGSVFRSASGCQAALDFACDTTALGLFNLYPSPNVPLTPFTNPASLRPSGDGAFNVGQASNHTASDNLLERVDLRVNSRTSMSFKHNILWINQLQGGDVPAGPTYPGSGTRVNGRNQNVSYNYVQQFTPRTANEFRFGWNRFRLTTTSQDASIDLTALGFQNLNPNIAGLPSITIGGASGASATLAPDSSLGAGSATPTNRADNLFSFADNFSLTRGHHTWKFGGEFRDVRLNVNNEALGRGLIALFSVPIAAQFGFSDVASIARVCPQSLPLFSSVFAGQCTQFGSGFERNFSTRSSAGFVQDQWRLSHNFTLNFGIRYEVNTAPVDRDNRLVNFYPSLVTTLTPVTGTTGGLMRAGSATIYDPFGDVIGTAPHAAPRAGYDTDYNDWGPRFGFAWDPWKDGKTVVRGGYALMFDQQPLQASVNQLLNPPFVQQNLSAFTPFPFAALSDNFSACAPFFTVGTGGCLTTSTNPNSGSNWFRFPYSIAAIDPRNKTPYVHQFHLGVERQLGNSAIFQVSYVGAAAHKLPALGDISRCPTAAFLANSDACFSVNSAGAITTFNPFLFTSILDQENAANSNYSSLQVLFETRAFHRLQLRGFYQFAKSIDDSSSQQPQVFLVPPLISSAVVSRTFDNPGSFATANNISPTLTLQGNLPVITTHPNLPQQLNNLAGERARSDFDVHHRFVLDYIYAVPRWAPKVGTGWELAGITTVQSGQPFSVYVDSFGASLRPSLSGPVHINNDNPQAAIDNGTPMTTSGSAFNLKPTASLQPGALGRNSFTGPKLINFDFAVIKNTFLSKSERANLMFKAEFFNLFNNANFRQPYSKGGLVFFDFAGGHNCGALPGQPAPCFFRDPFFGQILQAFPARQIQFALKLSF
jgi:outer membrane receptor protein involved in Fe transport